MENKYTVAIICHKPYIKFLRTHIESIGIALKGRKVKILLIISQVEKKDVDLVKNEIFSSILKYELNIELFFNQRLLSIGKMRNILWKKSKTEWTIFFDTDTRIHKTYFDNLDKIFQKKIDNDVKAIAGVIGLDNATNWGMFEGYMDLFALIGKIKGINGSVYDNIFSDFYFPIDVKETSQEQFYKNLFLYLKRYKNKEIFYLQGFNQILHKDVFEKLGGFDNSFWSAEDREIATKIYINNYKIIFAPELIVFHTYNFRLIDIIKRKKVHGIWCSKFRKKYRQYSIVKQYDLKRILLYLLSTINPPLPFRLSLRGRLYYFISCVIYLGVGIITDMFS